MRVQRGGEHGSLWNWQAPDTELPPHEEVVTLLCRQGQFNFVHVIITPLDYECNLVSLQCRKGETRGWAGWPWGAEPP